MKKFLVAFDGLKFSQSALDYALFMATKCQAHLVGVFLDDSTYHSYNFKQLIGADGGVSDERKAQLDRQDSEIRDRSAELFESACHQHRISYSIHRDKNVALQELLHESVYADLVIIDSKETFTHYDEDIPTRFVQDLLTDVKCPVLVVPHSFTAPEKVLFLYDGEPSSVHAVKMFSYLVPVLKETTAEVFSIKSVNQSFHIPDDTLMREFMDRHYPQVDYIVEQGNSQEHIRGHLENRSASTLVVLGAYQRSRLSRWFKSSMADFLMRNAQVPLFIAHN